MTNAFLILLISTSTLEADISAVDTVQKTAFNCPQSIDWKTLPTEIKDGITYYRLVVSKPHLERNLKVEVVKVEPTATAWSVARTKGLVILEGTDWRATLDKAGYTATESKDVTKEIEVSK